MTWGWTCLHTHPEIRLESCDGSIDPFIQKLWELVQACKEGHNVSDEQRHLLRQVFRVQICRDHRRPDALRKPLRPQRLKAHLGRDVLMVNLSREQVRGIFAEEV